MLTLTNLIFLIPIIVFGLVTSIYDYKKEVIKNKHLIVGVLIAIISNSYYIWIGSLEFTSLLVNLASALLAGFLLYFIDAWTAGDGKLFIIYSLLLPPFLYSGFMTSYNILLNTFVPVFFILVFLLILNPKKLKMKEALNYSFDPYRVFSVGMVLFGFVSYITDFMSLLGIGGGYFVTIIILFFGFELMRSLPFNSEYLFIGIAFLRIITDFSQVFTFSYAFRFFSLVFVFVLFRFFFLYLGFYAYSKRVKIEELEEGMVPAEGIVEVSEDKRNRLERVNLLTVSFIGMISQKKRKFIHNTNFLKEKDIEKFKQLKEKGELPARTLLVHKTVPFAVYLFIGYILTILLGGSFIGFLR